MSTRLILILAALGWGSATTATKYALDGFGPTTLLLVKLAAAAVVLWAVLAVRGVPLVRRKHRIAVLGLFEPTLAYGALTLGLTYTSATNASLLGASEACFVVALAAVFLKEKIGSRSLIGLLLAFVGVLLIEQVFTVSPDLNVGDLLILGGNLAAAIYVIMAVKVAPTIDSLPLTAYQFLFGTLMSIPLAVWQWLSGREPFPTDVSANYWLIGALIGGVGFAGSFMLYNHVIKFVPAGLAGITLNLVPLFGVLTAVLFLGEHLTIWTVAGGAAVMAGVMFFPADKHNEPAGGHPVAIPLPAGPRSDHRPQVSVVVADDGTTHPLVRDLVVGRAPDTDPAVLAGDAASLTLRDPLVSRVHARVMLHGWQVRVTDTGSANGTFLLTPGQTTWTKLTPGTETPLTPGTVVAFGPRQIRLYAASAAPTQRPEHPAA